MQVIGKTKTQPELIDKSGLYYRYSCQCDPYVSEMKHNELFDMPLVYLSCMSLTKGHSPFVVDVLFHILS